ncbi:hypothetical protein GC105_06620 [Alkalibaculum sp. M08DMB]|uniref:Lipoprotein n=1 Tax=Alkalibaculum sporogenes TaxID=2655001 RepID=A0A6A7K8C3_9FIRM|nr:hypothetical protein [Alkalibaculum sporogenes]MPW25457.1 hypothetical protein [Alkalibaculum sporogenes]
MKRVTIVVFCLLWLTSCQLVGYKATKLFITPVDNDHYLITIDSFKGEYEGELLVEDPQIFKITAEVESGDVLFELYSPLNEELIYTGYVDSGKILEEEINMVLFSGQYKWIIQSSKAKEVKIELKFSEKEH